MHQSHDNPCPDEGTPARPRRQVERRVAGVIGLFVASYPSGLQTFIFRFRDPRTGRKRCLTLGQVAR